MFLDQRALLFGILLLGLVCLSIPGATPSTAADDGVRIDVPADARVRIENQFGQVIAAVWREKYVSVSATIDGTGAPFTRSPIVIENRAKMLLISVIRTPVDPPMSITLTVRLPEGAHSEIVTGPDQYRYVANLPPLL